MRQIINIWNLAWNNKKYSFYELSFSNNGILPSPDKASQDSPPQYYLFKQEDNLRELSNLYNLQGNWSGKLSTMNLFVGESFYLFSIPCYATSLTVNYVWLGVNRAAVLTHRRNANIFHPFRKFFHCSVSILNPIIKYCCRYRMLWLIYTKIMSPFWRKNK